MSSLVSYERFDKNGIELIVDCNSGETFATVNGYGRMSGKDKSTISRRLKGVAPEDVKTAEILTPGGLQGVTLISEDLIVEWLPKDNPKMATQLMKLGVRVFLHKLAGYEVTTTAVEKELSRLEILTMALDSEKKYLAEQAKSKKLEGDVRLLTDTLVEQKPLVTLAETLVVHDVDTVNISEFAKSMGIGRNKMFSLLREIKFLQQDDRTPYQHHINAGYAEVYRKPRSHQPGHYDTVTVLTAKGQKYICKKLANLEQQNKVEVQMEYVLDASDF